MKLKQIGLKLAAAAMTAAMGLQMTVQPIQAAAASTQYLSEVIISYGRTDDEAKNWLTDNGYKVVNQNLNEGGEGGSDALSWLGLASEKRSVYLGYKTTTNADEAITDMKIMNMNGGYSYEAYEKVLKELEQQKTHFLENIMAALTEYRANYAKGAVKAKIAHDNLNKFKDDDSGALMGDLLLNALKTEDEAAWQADPSQHADMVTILMQGNSTVVSEIMQNLAFAADTADDSFVNRAIAAAESSEKQPFDAFFDAYMEKHPGSTKDEAVNEMMRLYDDDAKMFASSLVGLRNYLSNYTQSGLSMDAEKEEAEAYFAEHEFEDATKWAGAANAFVMLSNVYYGDSSLAAYLVYNGDDFLTDSALLSGYDAFGLPQRAKLYPLIAQMSAGQRSLLEYTAMDRMLTMGLMDADTWQSTYATMQDAAFGVKALETCSVYAEVNRDDFKVGVIAVTNTAQGKQASTGESMDEGIFGVGVSYVTAGIFVGGIITTVAGAAIAAKNWTVTVPEHYLTIQNAVLDGKSIYSGMEAALNGNSIEMGEKIINSARELNSYLTKQQMRLSAFVEQMRANQKLITYVHTNDLSKAVSGVYSDKLTLSGPDGTISYNAGIKVNYDPDGNLLSVASHDGTVIYADGRTEIDSAIRKQYNETMKQINPDFYVKITDITLTDAEKAADALLDAVADADVDTLKEAFKDVTGKKMNGNLVKALNDLPEDKLRDVLEKYNEIHEDSLGEELSIDTKKYLENRAVVKEYMAAENTKDISESLQDIGETEKGQVDDAAEAAMTSGSGSTFWKWFGVGMAIVGLIMSAYSVYAAIDEMQAYYHQEMLPIPRKMVDLGYYENGTHCYIYYDCTKCNRTEMSMGNETLGDYGDLNGDVMKQWLALYTTKDTRAGSPIQAGFMVKKGTTQMPVRTVPLSFFGFDYAVNMTDTRFTYNNNANGIYLYYKQLTSKYTSTVETGNALVTTGVLSALGGAGICGLIVALVSERKKKDPTSEPTAA